MGMLDRPRVRILVDGWLVEGIPLADDEAARLDAAGLFDPNGVMVPPGPDRFVLKLCTLTNADGRRRVEAGFVAVVRSRVSAVLHDPEPSIETRFTLKTS